MKAIVASKPGRPEALKIINIDEPVVQNGEVRACFEYVLLGKSD